MKRFFRSPGSKVNRNPVRAERALRSTRFVLRSILACSVLVVGAGCANLDSRSTIALDESPTLTRDQAERHLREGRAAQAALLLGNLADEFGDPDVRRREALGWLLAGETQKARKALEEPGAADSSSGQLMLAVIAWLEGDMENAMVFSDAALQLDSRNHAAGALKGQLWLDAAEFRRARQTLAAVDKNLPETHALKRVVLHNLAITKFMDGDYVGADSDFTSFVALSEALSDDELLLAGAMSFAAADHEKAASYWQNLDAELRESLADRFGADSEYYAALDR